MARVNSNGCIMLLLLLILNAVVILRSIRNMTSGTLEERITVDVPSNMTGTLTILTPRSFSFDIIDAATGVGSRVYTQLTNEQGMGFFSNPRALQANPANPALFATAVDTLVLYDLVTRAITLPSITAPEARSRLEVLIPGQVSWDPSGQQLVVPKRVFSADEQILASAYIWHRETQRIQFITFAEGNGSVGDALWSPTGQHIAFLGSWHAEFGGVEWGRSLLSIRAGCWQSGPCEVLPLLDQPTFHVDHAAWFPDGQTLVYTGYNTLGQAPVEEAHELHTLDVASGDTLLLLTAQDVERALDAAPRPTAADAVLPAQPAFFRDVAVSPDGQQVAFLFYAYTNTDPLTAEMRLFFLNVVDGTLTPTDYVLPGNDLASPITPAIVGLAWGPPLPDGVLPTPPTPTP